MTSEEDQRFLGKQGDCGIELYHHPEGDAPVVEVFADCHGCGDVFTEETGLALTHALMKHYGIKG
jgi:hypothetical protein